MGIYDTKPERFLAPLLLPHGASEDANAYCAGFELGQWRCQPFASHLIEWLPDYALKEDELVLNHGNAYVKLCQAAVRVYTSSHHHDRGEMGEIALHAICRDFFDTVPISPRVFYKSSSNDVIKAFDLVHARKPADREIEIWLGESKLYKNADRAIASAINSVSTHIEQGFLKSQKLLLGPQIPKSAPNYTDIMKLFRVQSSIDEFLNAAVFVIGLFCESKAAIKSKSCDSMYLKCAADEMAKLSKVLSTSGLRSKLRLQFVYIPLASKSDLVSAFDLRLKGLQP